MTVTIQLSRRSWEHLTETRDRQERLLRVIADIVALRDQEKDHRLLLDLVAARLTAGGFCDQTDVM